MLPMNYCINENKINDSRKQIDLSLSNTDLKISIRVTSISFSKMNLTFYIIRIKMIINIDDIDKTQFYNHIF